MILFKQIAKAIFGILFILLLATIAIPQMTVTAHPPADGTPVPEQFKNPKYLKDPCEKQSNNLVTNGAMGPDSHDTPFGTVADGWTQFVFGGTPPRFRVVNNEGVDGISQQVFTSDLIDAGVMQTVHNLQPGTQYWLRLGWAPAAKTSGTENAESLSVGRKIGVDPYGGTDAKSPNILWGPDYFGDTKGLNRLQLIMLFPAYSPNATVFLRVIAKDNSGGENRVWLDAVCMEARPELPIVPVQPTPTSLPPTPTVRPPQARASPTRTPTRSRVDLTKTPVATTVAPVVPTTISPGETPVLAQPEKPTARAQTEQPTIAPIRARPVIAPSTDFSFDPDPGTLNGIGAGSIAGSFVFFFLGIILFRQVK